MRRSLGECRARMARRGAVCGWSGASISSLWPQVFDDGRGGYGARLVEFVRVLEAVDDAVSGGEGAQGAASVVLARGRSPSLSGVHGCDKGAG